MNSAGALRTDCVYATLEDRQNAELRFRSAMITSTALHTGVALLILLAPFLIPKPALFEFTSVNLVELTPPPDPVPPPADTQAENPPSSEPEELPTPEEIEPLPPEDVPEDLEAQRRQEEEDEARRREEEKRRQEELETQRRAAEEAARRRQQEEERRRLEEEEARRRAPQKATREEATPAEPSEVTQQAQRGEVGLSLTNDTGTVSQQDQTLLQFWINRVLANIASKWDPPSRPPGSQEILAILHFRVGRNGEIIIDPETRPSSGNRRYDDAAVRAILAGQPFPPLPQGYRGNTLGINLGFRQ
jgi:outer membrane biosynthesis protein TonB